MILGLDLSISSTGWSIVDLDTIVSYGKIKTKQLKTKDIKQRLKFIVIEIKKIIEKFSPTAIIIEDVYHGVNAKTVAILNRLNGAVIVSLPDNIDVKVINVSHARKVILTTGKRHDKNDVFLWAVSKYKLKNFNFKDHNDITDSILLAHYGSITL